MEDWFATQPVYSGPSTNDMDKTTAEDRDKLVALCADCNEWHHFTRKPDTFLSVDGQFCVCGSKRFVGGTTVSERTWNPKVKIKKHR